MVFFVKFNIKAHWLRICLFVVWNQFQHWCCGVRRCFFLCIANVASQYNCAQHIHCTDYVCFTCSVRSIDNRRTQHFRFLAPFCLYFHQAVVQSLLLGCRCHRKAGLFYKAFIIFRLKFKKHIPSSILRIFCKTKSIFFDFPLSNFVGIRRNFL